VPVFVPTRDRWRLELVTALADCATGIRRGATPTWARHRLEGMLRAIDYQLEQARRS
jgi:hypothetical protein